MMLGRLLFPKLFHTHHAQVQDGSVCQRGARRVSLANYRDALSAFHLSCMMASVPVGPLFVPCGGKISLDVRSSFPFTESYSRDSGPALFGLSANSEARLFLHFMATHRALSPQNLESRALRF